MYAGSPGFLFSNQQEIWTDNAGKMAKILASGTAAGKVITRVACNRDIQENKLYSMECGYTPVSDLYTRRGLLRIDVMR